MKSPWRLLCGRSLRWGAVAVLAFAGSVVACGPEFPNRYYTLSEGELLAAPEGYFAAEIARIVPLGTPRHRAVQTPGQDERVQTVEVDIAEVKRALAEAGVADPDRGRWDYEQTRRELEKWVAQLYTASGERVRGEPSAPPELQMASEIPAEFRLYLEGAVAWHQRHLAAARRAWQALLELPESRRRFRTVWASYMLGRLAEEEFETTNRYAERDRFDAAMTEVHRRMRETRELVASGFPDPLGLATASYGWEAKAALVANDFPMAINLYLLQHAAGDRSALASLQRAARDALSVAGWRDAYGALARDETSRRVITAYLVARGGPGFGEPRPAVEQMKAWAAALEQAHLTAVPDADRLAWLAYEAGLFALAERWAALAPADSSEAQWIRAKFAMRAGNLRGAERLLRAALESGKLGEAHRRLVCAELGRVCLAQDDFKGALAAAVEGGHWEDAAFVAERVMSLDELASFVDNTPGLRTEPLVRWSDDDTHEQPRTVLKHLLARRLARAGKADRAESYFPEKWRPMFHDYAADVRTGFDATRPAPERAAAFWRAAQTVREHGMELFGTELEPDWSIWAGNFSLKASTMLRREGPGNIGGVFAPTPSELQRLDEYPAPDKRFHYRYRAADLAWWAAALLPNDSDEAAQILNTAGGWLKGRDPEAAQRFYQALVIRCPNTQLGGAATKAHWFPKQPEINGL